LAKMPVMNEPSERMKKFKNRGKDAAALRRQRVEVQVELRKAQKDEQILKRRSISITLMEKSPTPEDKNVVSAGCMLP
uniref:IBB domain-containing protein n=1 Tax=Anas platyrhynchos platyrhynchos TaxID=8840 RepID=A0A493U3Y7_ANAPP